MSDTKTIPPLKKNIFNFTIIALGLCLRLIWPSDMEWKEDEKDMYAMAHKAVDTGTLPAAGMRSGGGLVNPGLSVAPFALFAMYSNDPVAMNRMVQLTNVLAVCCFLLFILLKLNGREQQLWLSGLALAAVSPLAVLFSRKIWAQDMLPIFSFLVIVTNYHRHKRWGAFLWGLSGAIIGQIHMSGFFYAAGIFVITVLHDHYKGIRFRWLYWIAGSVIGSVTIFTWIIFILHNPQISRQDLSNLFQFNFFIHWFTDSQGINIYYSLRGDFWQYLREPVFAGTPPYLVVAVHVFLIVTSALALKTIVRYIKTVYQMIRNRFRPAEFFRTLSTTRFYFLSLLLGLGVFMTLSCVLIHPHYLICAFPFQYIFAAKIFENRRILFRWIVIAQLAVTFSFLVYIHKTDGAPNGDYGVRYNVQIPD
jgi:hypothetical protein